MKICHITSVHSQTDTRIFLKECISLVQAGFEVHFIVPGVESSVSSGVYIHGIKKNNGNRIDRMTKTVDAVYKKSLEMDADVYHFHDSELIPIGRKLKKKCKVIIYDIHEDLPRAILSKKWINPLIRKPMSKIFEAFENKASSKFDYLITATPFITERFKELNNNTVNINNYPLLKELENLNEEKQNSKLNQVCYVGGLGPIRGSHQLIEATKFIRGSLKIAGPLNSKRLEEKLIDQDQIEYLGFLNRGEVKNLLSTSVAGLVTFLPEPNHINAQPNKMFEYMSASIPVICSDFPLWRSIIERHDCGLCVDPEDPQAIADAINYLFDNPEIAKRMGQNGRKAVETEYNWEKESRKLLDVYNEIYNESRNMK